jgi:hypothetical protein
MGEAMQDETEDERRELVAKINAHPLERAQLEAKYGTANVWDTDELQSVFAVRSFLAPFTIVVRKSDGKTGTLLFQHAPRFYFDFEEKRDLDSCLKVWTLRDKAK